MRNRRQAKQLADQAKRPRGLTAGWIFALACLLMLVGLLTYGWSNNRYGYLASQNELRQAELQQSQQTIAFREKYRRNEAGFYLDDNSQYWKHRTEANQSKLDWETTAPFLEHLCRLGLGIAALGALLAVIGFVRMRAQAKLQRSSQRPLAAPASPVSGFEFLAGDAALEERNE